MKKCCFPQLSVKAQASEMGERQVGMIAMTTAQVQVIPFSFMSEKLVMGDNLVKKAGVSPEHIVG